MPPSFRNLFHFQILIRIKYNANKTANDPLFSSHLYLSKQSTWNYLFLNLLKQRKFKINICNSIVFSKLIRLLINSTDVHLEMTLKITTMKCLSNWNEFLGNCAISMIQQNVHVLITPCEYQCWANIATYFTHTYALNINVEQMLQLIPSASFRLVLITFEVVCVNFVRVGFLINFFQQITGIYVVSSFPELIEYAFDCLVDILYTFSAGNLTCIKFILSILFTLLFFYLRNNGLHDEMLGNIEAQYWKSNSLDIFL